VSIFLPTSSICLPNRRHDQPYHFLGETTPLLSRIMRLDILCYNLLLSLVATSRTRICTRNGYDLLFSCLLWELLTRSCTVLFGMPFPPASLLHAWPVILTVSIPLVPGSVTRGTIWLMMRWA
jgi:hypothetical protein